MDNATTLSIFRAIQTQALETAAEYAESLQHAIDHPDCASCRTARAAAAMIRDLKPLGERWDKKAPA